MKHVLCFLFLALSFSTTLQAQSKIVYSDPFPEPRDGWNRLLTLNNGSTAYLSMDDGDLRVQVFNKEGKKTADQKTACNSVIKSKHLSKSGVVKAMFQVGNDIALFMTTRDGCGLGGQINCVQTLYRFIIDPATGKITKGDELGATERVRSWGYTLQEIVVNDIFVEKDPVSDMYAVLLFNGYSEDAPDRIVLQVYDNNQPVKTATLQAPSTTDRATHYDGMCVYNKNVYLATNTRNAKEKGLDIPICISVLKNGADKFETKELKLEPFAINSRNDLSYNAASNTLQLLTTTETDSKFKAKILTGGGTTTHYYASGLTLIDPATLDIKSVGGIKGEIADAYAKQKLKEPKGFNGVIPAMYVNSDNSTTLIPEETYQITSASGAAFGHLSNSYTASYTSKIGLIVMNDAGKEKEGYVLRIREISGARTLGKASPTYFDYKYFNSRGTHYVILNDIPENFEKPEHIQPHTMTSVSDANTIIYKFANGSIERHYLFGEPAKARNTRFSMISESVFDEKTNTLATIVVSGENKQARIAWVTLD